MVINDNQPILMLDGTNMEVNYSVMYFERQPYLTNPVQVFLSRSLAIKDIDIGLQTMSEANITILEGS